MKKHILVISQYFYPEQFRINDICAEWINRGYKVTVVTGIPNYPQGKYYDGYGILKKNKEKYKGIDIIRIPLVPRGNNPLMLALNYSSFVFSGYIWKLLAKIKADYVFIFEVSPMSQALPGVWYAKKRKIPCYIYVQDLWPENVEIITGIKNKYILGSIGKMVDYIYKSCDRIFTTSKSFVDSIHERGVPKSKIEYWPQFAEDFYVPVEKNIVLEIPNDNSFNIIFAGNIGQAQGLDILPKAAKIIKSKNHKSKIRFNIVGDGRYKTELINLIKDLKLEDMFNFIPKQPATRIPQLMAANDAAFLSLSNNPLFTKTIPAKLQSYMACGIPTIASANGETNELIKSSNGGVCSPAGNAEMLAEQIIKLSVKSQKELSEIGHNARNYYNVNFNKDELLNRMDGHFGEASILEGNVCSEEKLYL